MLNFLHLSYRYLSWRRPAGPPEPVPEGLTRSFVATAYGDLELLCARPPSSPSSLKSSPVVVFAHGGMGGAWVWHEYMRYLAANGIVSYALSMRGHGASWHPSFLRMLYATTTRDLADDLVAGVRAVQHLERREAEEEDGDMGRSQVVLVGHSSGGGLSQFIVAEGDIQVTGIALLGAIPGTGSLSVYRNWVRFDPWSLIRMLLHGWHSNSPLSHPYLTKRAFFSDDYPDDKLFAFQRRLSRYESFLWPLSMMFWFVDPKRVLKGITGWGKGRNDPRMLVMAGTAERLMTREVQEKTADTYRVAFSELVQENQIDAEDQAISPLERDECDDNIGHGVELAWVPGAGHHLQNDVSWEIGAKKLLEFVRRL